MLWLIAALLGLLVVMVSLLLNSLVSEVRGIRELHQKMTEEMCAAFPTTNQSLHQIRELLTSGIKK